MPRIEGVNVVGVLVACIVFYFMGFLFYGVLFNRVWLLETLSVLDYANKAINIDQLSTELLRGEMKKAYPEANGALGMVIGFVNAMISVTALAVVIRFLTAEAPGLAVSLLWTAIVVVGFVLTSVAYDHIYAMKSMTLFWVDVGHLICAYVAAAIVLTILD